MTKISKESKLVFCMGDFNVNLLNYVNTMISHYLLPCILHPARVTDDSEAIIDNIFSNNTIYESVSGNIITRISDHFPQFIILNKVNFDYKICSYAKRDFSKFDKRNLWMILHGKICIFYRIKTYRQTQSLICFTKMCLHV